MSFSMIEVSTMLPIALNVDNETKSIYISLDGTRIDLTDLVNDWFVYNTNPANSILHDHDLDAILTGIKELKKLVKKMDRESRGIYDAAPT